jgi:hypothetical protein
MPHLAWIESEVGSRSRLSERNHHTTESFDPTRVGSVARTRRTLSIACGLAKSGVYALRGSGVLVAGCWRRCLCVLQFQL